MKMKKTGSIICGGSLTTVTAAGCSGGQKETAAENNQGD